MTDQPIRSLSSDQNEILKSILSLHCEGRFDCDSTFGNGAFYSKIERPKHCFDLDPQLDFVVKADSGELPLGGGSISSLVFDPPFLTYVRNGRSHKDGRVAMTSRFGGYWKYDELVDHYSRSINETYRVLRKGGVMVFKCQDIIHNHRMHCTHQMVINKAESAGFRLLDLFVLAAKHRMPGPQRGRQRHARIWHSYFLVLKKP